jgi:DNA-binding response OmpR family regulator
VLDIELPDADGLDILATIRALSDVPVIALTGLDEQHRIAALRGGADDCVSKPAPEAELQARLEALLRRPRQGDLRPVVLTDEYLEIDRIRHRVSVLGHEVALTPIEFRMLATFAENPGRVLGHGQLLELVWGDRIRERDEVKLYVSYLRRKLGAAAAVDPVETVRGVGYRYRPRLLKSTGSGEGEQHGS